MHYMSGEGSPNVGFFQTSVVLPVERQITTLGTGVCPHPSPHLQTNNLDGYMGMTAILLRRGVGPVLGIEGRNNREGGGHTHNKENAITAGNCPNNLQNLH